MAKRGKTIQSAPIETAWADQLTGGEPEPWTNGRGILFLCALLLLWFSSLLWRFTNGETFVAGLIWLFALALWLGLQIYLGRRHLPERFVLVFSTVLQAVLPTALTLVLVWHIVPLRAAAVSIATSTTVTELVAIHALRLAAWGTIAKYLAGQLPRYFMRYASLPDFGFAILASGVAVWMAATGGTSSAAFLWAFSILGIFAFIGAATTMYFGVPGSPVSWRWKDVLAGNEAPTFLPFRWPMNLAPAFCGPAFWLAHGLMFGKLTLS